jgi:predicted ATPase
MLYKVENFKSLRNTGTIEIAPITIFIGPNGTGKSSALQPLLFLSQTLANSREEIGFLPNGEYLRLGNYYDFINQHDIKKKLNIFFDFDLNCKDCKQQCFKDSKKKNIEDTDIGDIPPSKYEIIFKCGKDYQPELEEIKIYDCLNRFLLSRKILRNKKYDIKFFEDIEDKNKDVYDAIINQMPQNFIFEDYDIIDLAYKSMKDKQLKTKKIEFEKSVSDYLGIISFNKKNIITKLIKIKYVGPIREEAKRIYEYNKENFAEVGRFGEDTVFILFQNIKNEEKRAELIKWLKVFGLADDFRITTVANHPELFVLEFREAGKDYYTNYADSCFGLSQLLPILVQSIYSKIDDIVIIEQPELHLNPSLESILAEFFIKMINHKKLFMIETHSEYLLLRLRTYIKTGKIDSKKVAVYFTENIEGGNIIRKINIDKNGDFPNNDWPIGFFEQSLAENLMFATAVKQ